MTAVWRIGDEIAWTDGPDRVAVLDLDRPALLPQLLTDSGAVIWRAVDGERDEDSIIAKVAAEYDVPHTEIGETVLAFLAELAERHLIVQT